MACRRRSARTAAWLTGAALLAAPAAASGAPGDLDPAFSGDGRLNLRAVGPFVARAMTLQPDGRIVVAGASCEPDAGTRDGTCLSSGSGSFRLVRLTPDGGLDPEFGDGGLVTTRIGAGRSQAFDVLRLPSGAVVAAGAATDGRGDVAALARYDARGALDPAFGGDGIVLERVAGDFAAVVALAPGPDGTVYAGGQSGRRMLVMRFLADGRPDRRFGIAGAAVAGPAYGYVTGLAEQPDGGVVAAGIAGASADPATYRFGLLRVSPTGETGPVVEQTVGTSTSFASAAAPLAGGGWLAAGAATVPDGRQAMAVVRGTGDGAITGESMATAGNGALANDVVALPDGRAYAVGHVVPLAGGLGFGATRLLADGLVDLAFGTSGTTTVTWEQHPYARATAGAVDAEGRLVTAGIGCDGGAGGLPCTGGTAVLLVARQLTAPEPAPAPTPTPTPNPTVTPEPLRVRLSGLPARVTRAALRRAGLRLRVQTSLPAQVTVLLRGHKRERPGRTLLATADRRTDGDATFRLTPREPALRRTRAGTLRILVRATAAGRTVTGRSRLALR